MIQFNMFNNKILKTTNENSYMCLSALPFYKLLHLYKKLPEAIYSRTKKLVYTINADLYRVSYYGWFTQGQ